MWYPLQLLHVILDSAFLGHDELIFLLNMFDGGLIVTYDAHFLIVLVIGLRSFIVLELRNKLFILSSDKSKFFL